MLKKLISYDLRFVINKALIIYYLVTLGMALLTRILFCFDDVLIVNIIAKICSGVTISAMFSTVINNVIRCWVRFSINLFADESYLTHTLPVKRQTHFASKFCSAAISLLISFAVILLSVLIAYYSESNVQYFKQVFLPVAEGLESSMLGLILMLVFVAFLELLNMVQSGYIGALIGHGFNSGKTGLSILFGFVAYIVSQGIALVLICGISWCFDAGTLQIFTQNTLEDISVFKSLIWASIITYGVVLILGFFVGTNKLKKGVNVD